MCRDPRPALAVAFTAGLISCYELSSTSPAGIAEQPQSEQTVVIEETNWAALADPELYFCEWFDPARLPELKAWVNWEKPYNRPKWDAGPPAGLTKRYSLVRQGSDGSFRPRGPSFYPQEEYDWIYPRRNTPCGRQRVWTPTAPKAGNWIEDPGLFGAIYCAFAPRRGETWRFNNAYHLYTAFQFEGAFGFPDPRTFLSAGDLAIYEEYSKRRRRLDLARGLYYSKIRDTFDRYDQVRLEQAMRDLSAGGVLEIVGDLYLHRTLRNATGGFGNFRVQWLFKGKAIRGRGAAVSSIRTLPGATFEHSRPPLIMLLAYPPPEVDSAPVEITIADLSIHVTEPLLEWIQHGVPANFVAVTFDIACSGRRASVTWDGVHLLGTLSDRFYGLPAWTGRSVLYGLATDELHGGNIAYRRVHVENASLPINPLGCTDTTIVVGGSPEAGCTLKNCVAGVDPELIVGGMVRLTHNKTENAPVLSLLFPPAAGDLTFYEALHNEGQIEGSDFSIFELWNDFGAPMRITIDNNILRSGSHLWPFGPVFTFSQTDVLLTNSVFVGGDAPGETDGDHAVYVEALDSPGTGFSAIGNDFRGFRPAVAHVLLGPGTFGDLVVGDVDATTTVLDLTDPPEDGYQGANTLINVNGIRGRLGRMNEQELADLLADRRELRGRGRAGLK